VPQARASIGFARPAGFEPATHGLEGRRSIQLSYGREACSTGKKLPEGRWAERPVGWGTDGAILTSFSRFAIVFEDADVKGTRHRSAAMRVVACMLAISPMLASEMPNASAATKVPTVTRVSVLPSNVWTDTGVTLRSGDSVTIRLSGRIHFGAPPIDRLSPAGIPRGKLCDRINARVRGSSTWPAPKLDCWSAIGRIGAGQPFAVGNGKTIHAATDGALQLGVNDNFLRDNSGKWAATVIVIAPPAKQSTNFMPFVLLGIAVLGGLGGIVLLVTRARRNTRARPARKPKPARARKPAPIPKPPPVVPVATGAIAGPAEVVLAGGVAAPASSEFTEVNIFEVEFSDSTSLRVGYNYFPAGTVVQVRVAQRAKASVTGEFVTDGGGSQYHFVTVPLGSELEPNPDGADVYFTWDIGGVPFQYSVRRAPVR
jgi:hypothetical protein